MIKKFKKAQWEKFSNKLWKFKCNNAVYAWVLLKDKKYNYTVALNYGTQKGVCSTLKHAKTLVELMVLGTKTTLYQHQND